MECIIKYIKHYLVYLMLIIIIAHIMYMYKAYLYKKKIIFGQVAHNNFKIGKKVENCSVYGIRRYDFLLVGIQNNTRPQCLQNIIMSNYYYMYL